MAAPLGGLRTTALGSDICWVRGTQETHLALLQPSPFSLTDSDPQLMACLVLEVSVSSEWYEHSALISVTLRALLWAC